MRISLQPAYVIHSRPYRDSSALLDVFTAEFGRISLVARGARRQSRRGSHAGLLQPFTPLLVTFSGRLELKTLVAVEPAPDRCVLSGDRLFSGLYVNELLVRLLHRNDAHPSLFASYSATLQALAGSAPTDTVLRRFEMDLLDELGYRLELEVAGANGQRVEESGWYRYDPEYGLLSYENVANISTSAISGADLLAMARGEFGGSAAAGAKKLLREALAVHLGGKPLRSRELFLAAGGNQSRREN